MEAFFGNTAPAERFSGSKGVQRPAESFGWMILQSTCSILLPSAHARFSPCEEHLRDNLATAQRSRVGFV
jgi:hypothetical protein